MFKQIYPILRTACRINIFNQPANFNNFSRIHNSSGFKGLLPLSRNFSSLPDNSIKQADELVKPTDDSVNPEIVQPKLDILKLEVSVLRQEGRKVPDPDQLKQQNWKHLLSLPTKTSRIKYYAYLWKLEKKKENEVIKKEKRQVDLVERRIFQAEENAKNDHIIYSLTHTTIFLRIYDTTMNLWHNNKLTRAMQFGQKLILDCSYDEYMVQRESINCAKQLMLCFASNRIHDEPFDLYLCNAELKSTTIEYLQKHIPNMMESYFPLNVHPTSYLDLFPKERLVYLTPHCKNDLETFDPDAIYIIGAMVDKINNEPHSMAKAKKLGIKMARLPLDRYLQWSSGSGKSLAINQMVDILLDVRRTNDWTEALKHVPKRKIANEDVEEAKLKRGFTKSMAKFNLPATKRSVTVHREENDVCLSEKTDNKKVAEQNRQKDNNRVAKYLKHL